MVDKSIISETKYLAYLIKTYKKHLKLEALRDSKGSFYDLTKEERKDFGNILLEKYLYGVNSQDYRMEIINYGIIYKLNVNDYYHTSFNSFMDCYKFVLEQLKGRREYGFYKRLGR